MSQALTMNAFKERAYRREALFAIDVLDAITLQRVGPGVKIVVKGLAGKPTLNPSGLYVWRKEDARGLRRISIDPRLLPYEAVELSPAEIAEIVQAAEEGRAIIQTVQLPPRANEPLSVDFTMLRGAVLESPSNPMPLPGASATIEWRDGNVWKSTEAAFPIRSASGTFITVLRLPPDQFPPLDADGNATVRLRVRVGAETRVSPELPLPWQKATTAASPFFWHELYLYL